MFDNIFEVHDKTDNLAPCYGLEKFTISKKDVESLLEGKVLSGQINEGEYAITIELEDEKH